MRNLYLGIFWFLGAIVFVLVVLATSNTLVMTVMERVREIGTLRAIGTAPGRSPAMVLWEALWLGVLGALLGDALGAAVIARTERPASQDAAAAGRRRSDRPAARLRA